MPDGAKKQLCQGELNGADVRKRVFLLGPSHHARIAGVALSPFSSYATPLGEIPLCEKSKLTPCCSA